MTFNEKMLQLEIFKSQLQGKYGDDVFITDMLCTCLIDWGYDEEGNHIGLKLTPVFCDYDTTKKEMELTDAETKYHRQRRKEMQERLRNENIKRN